MASNTPRSAPLAGKPPFATDEPDSVFERAQPRPQRKREEPVRERETSAYDVYDHYLNDSTRQSGTDTRQSGFGALGMGLMTADMDDSDEDSDDETLHSAHQDRKESPSPPTSPKVEDKQPANKETERVVPLAAPKPGYAAPVDALNKLTPPASLPSILTPGGPSARQHDTQMSQVKPTPILIPSRGPGLPIPTASPSVPSTPHPLQPPMTPITPAFTRPPKSADRDVKFTRDAILRGNTEETLLPKRGERGDDFWRRFSIVAKDDISKKHEQSTWLRKHQSGNSKMSFWVWIIAVLILAAIGGGIYLGWHSSHNNNSSSPPRALGGSANSGANLTVVTTTQSSTTTTSSSSQTKVTPTNTVQRRHFMRDALPTPAPIPSVDPESAFHLPVRHRHRSARAF